MEIATYHRASTVDQDPTAFRGELVRFAGAHGWTIAHAIEETGSGRDRGRPGFAELRELVRKRRVAGVLVWKISRLARSTMELLSFVELCESHAVRLVCVSEAIDTGTPVGRLTLTVLAAVAQMEAETIAENTRAALAAARARGKRLGRPATDPKVAARIHELRAAGHSHAVIADATGVGKGTVGRVLARPTRKRGAKNQLALPSSPRATR